MLPRAPGAGGGLYCAHDSSGHSSAMRTNRILTLAGAALVLTGFAAVATWRTEAPESPALSPEDRQRARIRTLLFQSLTPVSLSNCSLERFGESHDGGYLLCGNLLQAVRAGYSYGISGYDGWGCEVSTTLGVPVHQYDCFNTTEPVCAAKTVFHAACIGPLTETIEGRVFDTLQNQIAANGDAGVPVVVKMDVEGAEWDSLLETPDDVLQRIEQLAIEFHHTDDMRYVRVVERLKQYFYIVNFHLNNFSCEPGHEPFPGWAYEVLFVNKRLGVLDPDRKPAQLSSVVDTPNTLDRPDCQPSIGQQ